jgi:integrase
MPKKAAHLVSTVLHFIASGNIVLREFCCQYVARGESSMPKKTLNDRTLRALKPAPAGETYDLLDTLVPGFGVRVSETGRRTFILVARFPGRTNPTRRALGEYGALTLAAAREKARDWLEMLRKGIDPREDQERQRVAEQRRRGNSFRVVAEEFIQLALIGPDPEKPKQRKGYETKRDIENEFIARWNGRPITDITPHDVMAVIDAAVVRGAPYQAHNLLGHIRRLFNWAIARGLYGLDRSPCDRMKPKEVIGKKALRTRVLTDAELAALWRATEATPYPYGPLFRLLAITGQRKSEVAEAQWSEFDLGKKLWAIPASRMKSDAAHAVPLSDDAVKVLESLPRFQTGQYLFSTTFGRSPVNGFSKAKVKLDVAMLAELRSTVGDKAELPPFVIHDVRRTVRTHLSALPVPDLVRELVIAHTKPGLHKVYDQHAYLDEKRHALTLWAGRLRDIVKPAPAYVVKLQVARP